MVHAPPIRRRLPSGEGACPSVPRGGRPQLAMAGAAGVPAPMGVRGVATPEPRRYSVLRSTCKKVEILLIRDEAGKVNGHRNETKLCFCEGYDRETVRESVGPHEVVS